MPRDEFDAIVRALRVEHAIAVADARVATPDQNTEVIKRQLATERALANVVYGYLLANPEAFPGGLDGPHGITLVRNIIGHPMASWSTLKVRPVGITVSDL